jgi:uncharacterized protein YhbP (UPF0306 family)
MVCIDALFWTVGCEAPSTSVIARSQVLNEQITNVLLTNSATLQRTYDITNSIRLEDIHFECKNIDFKVAQTIDVDAKTVTQVTGSQVTDIQNLIDVAIAQDVDAQTKVVKDFLSQNAGGKTTAELIASIQNTTKTNVTQENIAEIVDRYAVQNQSVIRGLTFKGDVCNFVQTQDILVRLMAVDIIDLAQRAAVQNSDVVNIINAARASTEVESKGVGGIITSFINAIKSLGIAYIIVIGVIIVAVIIGIVFLMKALLKSDVGTFVAQKAAQKAGL